MPIHKEKYQNTILYLCQKLGGEIRGKKKLVKLLYFVDFDFYEKFGRPITGATYRALPMGPFPSDFEGMMSDLSQKGLLIVERVDERPGYNPTEVYRATAAPDESALSQEEREILDRVVLTYGHLNGKQLEELSHAEAPYIGTVLHDEIPYELAYYRGTDFEEA